MNGAPLKTRMDQVGGHRDRALRAEDGEQDNLALAGALAAVQPVESGVSGADHHRRALREHRAGPGWRRRTMPEANDPVAVRLREQPADLLIRAFPRRLAEFDQADDARAALDRTPSIVDADEQIVDEQRHSPPPPVNSQANARNEGFITAQGEIIRGEAFAAPERCAPRPNILAWAEFIAGEIFGQGRNRLCLKPLALVDRLMPRLTPDELTILRGLSEPLDPRRRDDFMAEATRRLEAAPFVGPGLAHQIGRAVQRDFRNPPPDLRSGRIGPRGPRG